MKKTPTIFDRDWNGNRGVIAKLVVNPGGAEATEKIDGTNVRVTIRTNVVDPRLGASSVYPVRLEKRRNPTKEQKKEGISEPWYVDASRDDPADRFLFEALENTSIIDMPEGEWSAEAVGPKIQGNPLKLDHHRLFFFDRRRLPLEVCVPALDDVPEQPWPTIDDEVYFASLRDYVCNRQSVINPDVKIEGIVWHGSDGWAKIKAKDFK
jgi:hypothetical protein